MRKISLIAFSALIIMLSQSAVAQTIATFAGTGGSAAFSGDGGPATAARLNYPQGIGVDAAGNIYIADTKNHCIRKVTSGVISTVAGTGGSAGYSGDGGPATNAKMSDPVSVYVDATGNIFVAEGGNHLIRKINTAGIISTIAGTGVSGYNGDGITAISAQLNFPGGVWVDPSGNVYIGDTYNHRVRKINTSGIISTYAGNGVMGSGGDGGPATNAQLYNTNAVTMDAAGNLFMSDNGNHRIRKVNTLGIISTIAGNGTGGYITDGVPATSTRIFFPVGVRTDATGSLFFGEDGDSRVREVNATGIISTIAGNGTSGYSGDGGAATAAQLNSVTDVCMDAAGNKYIVDRKNHCIRIIGAKSSPLFTKGHVQTLAVCEGSSISIDTPLTVADAGIGKTETWSVFLAPAHGTLVAAYTTTSTGGTLTPTGLTYTPVSTYTGSDVFKVVVSDGVSTDTTTINVTVNPLPLAGIISGIDSVCPGGKVTLSETVAGGIWSTSSYTISLITSSGVAKGLIPGKDTIIYTVINSCGIVSAIFPFTVRSYIACHTEVSTINAQWNSGIKMHPNPSNGNITLEVTTTSDEDVSISIFNIIGKKVDELHVRSNQPVDTKLALPSGMYIIRATTAQEQWSGKLIIE